MNEQEIAEVVAELADELDVPADMDEAEAFTYIRAAYGAGYTDGNHDRGNAA